MRKVELSVMKPWIAKKTMDLLGFEDEVVIEYVSGLLEDEANPVRGRFSSTRDISVLTDMLNRLLTARK